MGTLSTWWLVCKRGEATTALWVWSTYLLFHILQWTHSRMKCVAGLPKCYKLLVHMNYWLVRIRSVFMSYSYYTKFKPKGEILAVSPASYFYLKKPLKGITTLFWDAVFHNLIYQCRSFGGSCYLHLQGRFLITVKVEVAHSLETWVGCRVVFLSLTKAWRSMPSPSRCRKVAVSGPRSPKYEELT
jgi:hypothetical protein